MIRQRGGYSLEPRFTAKWVIVGFTSAGFERRGQRRRFEGAKQAFKLETNRTLDLERERIREDAAKAVKEDYRIKDLEGENRTGELKKRITWLYIRA
jgi:hypothetical protein